MAGLGDPRTGGRKKGTPNKVTVGVQEIADKLGVNPFEILIRFAANDWEALGYDERKRLVPTKDGSCIEVDNIEPSERIVAAKAACEYLFPKRKSIEFNGEQSANLFNNLAALFKARADAKSRT